MRFRWVCTPMLVTFNNSAAGPTLEIGIAPAQSGIQAVVSPPPSTVWINAIADTGASATCVCAGAATRAALPIIGKGSIQSASHVMPVNQFFGDLWIRGRMSGGTLLAWPFRNRVFLELALPGSNYEALLGMDIFREGILMVHGPEGRTTFAW